MTERNQLIEAYEGAGPTYLGSRILILLWDDTQLEQAGIDPAVRSFIANEISTMLGPDGLSRLAMDVAERALQTVVRDTGEQK